MIGMSYSHGVYLFCELFVKIVGSGSIALDKRWRME